MANSFNAAEALTYVSATTDGHSAQTESDDQDLALINRLSEAAPTSTVNGEAGGLSNVSRQIGSGILDQVVNHPVELATSAATGLVLGNAFTVGLKVAKVPTLALALAGGTMILRELVRNAPEWAKNVGIAYNPEGVTADELHAAEAGLHSLGRGAVNFAVGGAAFNPGAMLGKRFLAADAGKTLGVWADKIGVGEHSALTRGIDGATGAIQARLGMALPIERLPASASLSGEEKAFVHNISKSIDGKNGLSAKFNTWADQILDEFKFDIKSQAPYKASDQLSAAGLAEHERAAVRHEIFKFLGDTSKPLTAVSEQVPARLRTAMDAIENQHIFEFSRKGELFSDSEMAALRQFRDLARAIDGVSNRAGTSIGPASIEFFNRANERSQLLEPFVNPATLADEIALAAAYKNAMRAQESSTPLFTFDEMQSIHQTMLTNKLQNPIAEALKATIEAQNAVLDAGLKKINEVKFPGMVPVVEWHGAPTSLNRFATFDEPRLKITFADDIEKSALSGTQTESALAKTMEAHAAVKVEGERILKANLLESGPTKVFPDMTGALTIETQVSPASSAVRFYNAKGEIQGYVTNTLTDDGSARWLAFDDANNLVGISVTRGNVQSYKNWLLNSRRSDGHPFPLPELFSEL